MAQVIAELDGTRIYLIADYSVKELCQQVPGCRWDKGAQQWHVPLSWASCKILRAVFQDQLEIGPVLKEWAQIEVEERITPSLALREVLTAEPLDPRLYSFQNAGARFMATSKQALLSDPMGAGKSCQTIFAIKLLQDENGDALPALIVCPTSMRTAWKREFNKWWPEPPVHVVQGTALKRKKIFEEFSVNPGVMVINIEAMRLHSRLAPYGSIALTQAEKTPKELNQIEWGTMVVDESHRLTSPKSKQTRACWAVARGL